MIFGNGKYGILQQNNKGNITVDNYYPGRLKDHRAKIQFKNKVYDLGFFFDRNDANTAVIQKKQQLKEQQIIKQRKQKDIQQAKQRRQLQREANQRHKQKKEGQQVVAKKRGRPRKD